MNRPYVICHMMSSLDGRIDCAMTAKCPGVGEYYRTLAALDVPTTLSGRVTAQLELAPGGTFEAKGSASIGKPSFAKNAEAAGYSVVADTKGTLLWDRAVVDGRPLVVLMSEDAPEAYTDYLNSRGVSWVACGKGRIDLARACEVLADEFDVERMGIVGGGTINAGFLDAGLLDEVSMLYAPAIDGRAGMTAAFDGLPHEREPFILSLKSVECLPDGAVWMRHVVKRS